MSEITLETADGSYNKDVKVISFVHSLNYPDSITVRSNHTGRVIRFVRDDEAAEANEFWDGELCEYKEEFPETGIRVVLSPSQW